MTDIVSAHSRQPAGSLVQVAEESVPVKGREAETQQIESTGDDQPARMNQPGPELFQATLETFLRNFQVSRENAADRHQDGEDENSLQHWPELAEPPSHRMCIVHCRRATVCPPRRLHKLGSFDTFTRRIDNLTCRGGQSDESKGSTHCRAIRGSAGDMGRVLRLGPHGWQR